MRRALDCLHRALYEIVFQDHFQLYLGQEINHILRAPVKFRMPLLAAKTLGLDHRDALKADIVQGFLHFIKFEGFDNRFYFFHRAKSLYLRSNRRGNPVALHLCLSTNCANL